MRVLALTKYGPLAASTRQRFMQYEPALRDAGIFVDYAPLLDNDHLRRVAKGKRASIPKTIRAYGKRFAALLRSRKYDVLWIHCELFPYLPALFEQLAGLARKPIIYDFDDAIFHMYDQPSSRLVRHLLKEKLAPLLRRAHACCCGNAYLQQYAARYCPNSIVIPTVVDTRLYRPREDSVDGPPVIGWIGSPTTWPNVRPLLPVLGEIAATRGVRIRAIGAGPAAAGDQLPGLELAEWREETEVEEVRNMSIGIMPLLDRPFERGKSGYKLIQYMACGLPVVGSPVGVNSEIVSPGNGYLAVTPDEWREALERLIGSADLRRKMGAVGRKRAVERYSLKSQAPRLVDLFLSVPRKGV